MSVMARAAIELPPRQPAPDPFSAFDARKLIDGIQQINLPPVLRPYIAAYEAVGHRDSFIWKWVHQGLKLTELPTVAPEWRDHVHIVKFLGVMFDVLLDDVADVRRDRAFLAQLLRVPFALNRIDHSLVAEDDHAYLETTCLIWRSIERLTRELPRNDEFADLWEFDYGQLLNCMRYALVISRDPRRINMTEHNLYQPHNMHMMISGTLDVMASPSFPLEELGRLREVLWTAQMMGRIGNMITTWKRELRDGDLTSGVFCRALEIGALTPDELFEPDPVRVAERIDDAGIEHGFVKEWFDLRRRLVTLGADLRCIDVHAFADALERLLQTHLASRGLK